MNEIRRSHKLSGKRVFNALYSDSNDANIRSSYLSGNEDKVCANARFELFANI